jgi:signal transduction histidine kinase
MPPRDRCAEIEVFSLLGHELKNLLATFVGFSELLLNEELPVEQQREYLETMRDEGLRATRLLHELLDLERMESGLIRPHVRPTDLRSLLLTGAAVAASDPAHPVVLECPTNLPSVLAEPDRVQQVLANLLANARTYSPDGGEIRLAARSYGALVEVSVSDRGLGIPREALPHLFDKFYRVDSPGHSGIRGTGLGLAICRQIIEAHGGYIWAESDGLGTGARFLFTLPAAARPRQASAPPAACVSPGRTLKGAVLAVGSVRSPARAAVSSSWRSPGGTRRR